MLLDDAILLRRSVRAFLNTPVERKLIEEVLALAVRSPSWGNTQPWEIVVVGGDKAALLANTFRDNVVGGVPGKPDFEMPAAFTGDYDRRYRQLGREVFQVKGIARDDQEARLNHLLDNFQAFGAPHLVYILIDQCLPSVYAIFDSGLLAAHIALAAVSRGLGTCLLAALTMYPDDVRRVLNIGAEKKVVLGLALGRPDPEAPINNMNVPRDPIANNVTFVGVG